MAKLYYACLMIFLLMSASECESLSNDVDTAQEVTSFPTTFPGLEHDLVFATNHSIMRINKQDNSTSTLNTHGTQHRPQHLRIGSNGTYLYFLDKEFNNSAGYVYQLNLNTNVLKLLSLEPTPNIILLNDDYIYTQQETGSCNQQGPFRFDILNRIENGERMLFCEAYATYAAANNTPTSAYSTSISYQDGLYLSTIYYFEPIDNNNVRRNFKVSFEVTGNQLVVVEFEEVDDFTDDLYNQDGSYSLKKSGDGSLWITETETGESTMIDENIDSLAEFQFVINDTYVLVKKQREYSRELFLKFGYHLYEISTGRYYQILEESQTMKMVRFSESGNQIVAIAEFIDNRREHVVVMSLDGETKAVVSNLDEDNLFPLFVY